jgi:hypothetical protein
MKENIQVIPPPPQKEEQCFLSRKELASVCRVSLATLNRGIRDGRWPYSAYIRISPRRLVYPASLILEIAQKAGLHTNLEEEAKK